MKLVFIFHLFLLNNAVWGIRDTCDRVRSLGFPCETHSVITEDGYKLTLFRMNKAGDMNRPAVLIQHGIFSSSDCFVINGPEQSIAFAMYLEGYDVWMGNFRGNNYSQDNLKLWNFSFHEMGVYDAPAMIDYILQMTTHKTLHYVAHSQGGTVFFVMASLKPAYFEKCQSIHLFGPAVFLLNVQSPVAILLSPLASYPNAFMSAVTSTKLYIGADLLKQMAPPICKVEPALEWCANLLVVFAGGPSSQTNNAIMDTIFATHPTDCSLRQLYHNGQIMVAQNFLMFDYGPAINLIKYSALKPNIYPLHNIPTSRVIHVYGALNDYLVSTEGLRQLSSVVANVKLEFVPIVDFNHMDFCFASDIRSILNDCIVDRMNQDEGRPFRSDRCHFTL